MIEIVLASTHVIEDAPLLANVGALKTDAQGAVANFTCNQCKALSASRTLAAKCR